ncbi:MAG: C-terminal binding protein [Proteobacteria bacterium]|nr:C-terminal binding protein [Pseudomonadota bacterium]
MSKLTIAVTDHVFPNLDHAERVLSGLDAEIRLASEPTEEAILEVAREADGLMVTFAQITAGLISGLERCKSIGRFGIGVDNIDLEAATKAGIQVTYVPDYCVDEVSDHALTLLLSLARKIPEANSLVQSGRWSAADLAPVYRIRGRTLGLAGLGKIPQTLAPKAQALGMTVIAADPFVPAEVAKSLDVELVDFDTLLARSDYISIHAPLTDETHHMFDADAFGKMKNEALLINTARGPLIDEEALVAALDAGEIGGAALDVITTEPPAADFPLLGRDNVILTPHAAFYSVDALVDLQTKAAEDVVAVLTGKTPRYPVNKLD